MRPLHPARIEVIVLHHTETERDTTVERIRQLHTNPVEPVLTAEERFLVQTKGWGAVPPEKRPGRGWEEIGYHWLIRLGMAAPGRPERFQGAHAPGWNHRSLAIALVGDYRHSWPDSDQLGACIEMVQQLQTKVGRSLRILGHQEAMAQVGRPGYTDCPGVPWVAAVRQAVEGLGPGPGDDKLYTG